MRGGLTSEGRATKAKIDRGPNRRPRAQSLSQEAARKLRIFARLAACDSYDEDCSARRPRAIVAEAPEKREIDPLGQFAQLQIARLNDALSGAHAKMVQRDMKGLDRLLSVVDQAERFAGRLKAASPEDEAPERIAAATPHIASRALPAPKTQPVAPAAEGAEPNRRATP